MHFPLSLASILIIINYLVQVIVQQANCQLIGITDIDCSEPEGEQVNIASYIPGYSKSELRTRRCLRCICSNKVIHCNYTDQECVEHPPTLENNKLRSAGQQMVRASAKRPTTSTTTTTTTTPRPTQLPTSQQSHSTLAAKLRGPFTSAKPPTNDGDYDDIWGGLVSEMGEEVLEEDNSQPLADEPDSEPEIVAPSEEESTSEQPTEPTTEEPTTTTTTTTEPPTTTSTSTKRPISAKLPTSTTSKTTTTTQTPTAQPTTIEEPTTTTTSKRPPKLSASKKTTTSIQQPKSSYKLAPERIPLKPLSSNSIEEPLASFSTETTDESFILKTQVMQAFFWLILFMIFITMILIIIYLMHTIVQMKSNKMVKDNGFKQPTCLRTRDGDFFV